MAHIPVLQKEVLEYLDPKPNENFIDATIGLGGHTRAILEKNKPNGKVLGIELDSALYKKLKETQIDRLILKNDSYANLKQIVEEHNFRPVQGILFDLGMSSWHLEESGRGFSFQRNEPLDMRFNPEINPLTAQEIVNHWPEKEIEKILKEYGEERFTRRIARKIIETRKREPIKTTLQLVEILGGRHFARRTFQALRIAVNDELENLKKALPQALEVLEREGKIVVISFHSLEDRIVKNFLKGKVIRPTIEEIQKNPRARSAKLRIAIKSWF